MDHKFKTSLGYLVQGQPGHLGETLLQSKKPSKTYLEPSAQSLDV